MAVSIKSMFHNSSKECLSNAESLLDDARVLLRLKKFSSAQSLSIISLEEVGKAIILELVDLNYYDKNLAKKAIYSHKSKKAIIKAIEKGLILVDAINREPGDASITQEEIKSIGEKLLDEMDSIESNRLNGLYVDVDMETGDVKSSPKDCSQKDAVNSVIETKNYIFIAKVLCDVFRQIKDFEGTVNNLKINFPTKHEYTLWKRFSRKIDRTVSISYDEA